jgi:hypothetical protein
MDRTLQFVVNNKPAAALPPSRPMAFELHPETLANAAKARDRVPSFHITGQLDKAVFSVEEPLAGSITVNHCDCPIKSIELQLVREASTQGHCHQAPSYPPAQESIEKISLRERTEIQNLQLADGNIEQGVELPIHMVLPRLFACATLELDQVSYRMRPLSLSLSFVRAVPHDRRGSSLSSSWLTSWSCSSGTST